MEKEDKKGWMILAQVSMKKIWENESDDKIWVRYLFNKENIIDD